MGPGSLGAPRPCGRWRNCLVRRETNQCLVVFLSLVICYLMLDITHTV